MIVFYSTLANRVCITIGIRKLRETSELYFTYYNEIGYQVMINKKWGFIDDSGKLVIALSFEYVTKFS